MFFVPNCDFFILEVNVSRLDHPQFVYWRVQDVLNDVCSDATCSNTHTVTDRTLVEWEQPRAMPQNSSPFGLLKLFIRREKRHERVRAAGPTHTHTKRFSHRGRRQSRDDSSRSALIGKLTDGLALRIFWRQRLRQPQPATVRPPCDLPQPLGAGACPHRLGKLLQLLRRGREEWQRREQSLRLQQRAALCRLVH